jgi:hypothetical protein
MVNPVMGWVRYGSIRERLQKVDEMELWWRWSRLGYRQSLGRIDAKKRGVTFLYPSQSKVL